MKVLFYSIRSYDKYAFEVRQEQFKKLEFEFTESALNSNTVDMAAGYDAVCIFVNDNAKDETVIKIQVRKVLPVSQVFVDECI